MKPMTGSMNRRAVLAGTSSAALAVIGAALLPGTAEAAPLPAAPVGDRMDAPLVEEAQAVVVVPRRRRRRVCWWRRGRRVCAWR
jgi:hypothetical protein